jgi:hypothetical protein
MNLRRIWGVLLPIAGVVLLLDFFGLKIAWAAEENISFSGTIHPACALSSPSQRAAYGAAHSPSLMVLRCNYGQEFRVVPVNVGQRLLDNEPRSLPPDTKMVVSDSTLLQTTTLQFHPSNSAANSSSIKVLVLTVMPQ